MHHRQNKGALWGPYTPSILPPKYIRMLRGLLPIHSKCRCGAQGLMWGARGAFLLAAAMVVAVVTRVVFCAKATEILQKCKKNTKISCLWAIILSITIHCKTYCNSRIANCSVAWARALAWPEPEPLWSIEPRHIGSRWKALVIVRTILTLYWGQKVGILEKERKGYPHHT